MGLLSQDSHGQSFPEWALLYLCLQCHFRDGSILLLTDRCATNVCVTWETALRNLCMGENGNSNPKSRSSGTLEETLG